MLTPAELDSAIRRLQQEIERYRLLLDARAHSSWQCHWESMLREHGNTLVCLMESRDILDRLRASNRREGRGRVVSISIGGSSDV